MQKHIALKLISAPALAAALAGSYIALAPRQRSARATFADQLLKPFTKTVTVKGDVELPPPGDQSFVVAGGGITSSRIEMTPHGLHVAVTATIHDRRPESLYFWGCRVDASGDRKKPIFEKLYLDQMFRLPESHVMTPTLDDTLVFPADPGKYRVEVIMFTIPPGFDMSRFRDPKYEQSYRCAGMHESVIIP